MRQYLSVSLRGVAASLEVLQIVAVVAVPITLYFLRNGTWSRGEWWVFVPSGIAVVAAAVAKWLRHCLERPRSPVDLAICAALQSFYDAAFGKTPGHRVTLFQRDQEGIDYHLVPTHRYSLGEGMQWIGGMGPKAKFSGMRFKKGEGVAGFAWDSPEELVLEDVPEAVSTNGGYEEWARERLKISEEPLKSLSRKARNQKLYAGWSFVDSRGTSLGVICADSEDRQPFRRGCLPQREFGRLGAHLRTLLEYDPGLGVSVKIKRSP